MTSPPRTRARTSGRDARLTCLALALILTLVASVTSYASDDGRSSEPLSWTRLGRVFGSGTVFDLVTLPDGGVLAGGTHSYPSARVWHAADGVDWEEVLLPGRDYGRVTNVDASDRGMLAIGIRSAPDGRPRQGVVWTSLDGLEWSERHQFDGAMTADAIATEDGYAVVTVRDHLEGPQPITVWHSADGDDWQAFQVSDELFVGPAVVAERTAAGAWVLAAAEMDRPVRLWRSDDGKSWEPTAEDVTAGWRLGTLVAATTGFLFANPTVEAGEYLGTGIWHSVDGREWTEVTTTQQSITAMAAGPTSVVALTTPPDRYAYKHDFPVTMLSSEDGLTWGSMEQPELEGKPFHKLAVLPDRQVLAIRQLNDITWLGRPAALAPLVLPEPTPDSRGELLDFRALVKSDDHPEGDFDQVAGDIIDYFETAGVDLDPIHLAAPPIDDLVRECKRIMRKGNDRLECVPVLLRLQEAHGLTRDRLPYELADRWLGVTMAGAHVSVYRQHLLERMRWNRVSHPDWLKG